MYIPNSINLEVVSVIGNWELRSYRLAVTQAKHDCIVFRMPECQCPIYTKTNCQSNLYWIRYMKRPSSCVIYFSEFVLFIIPDFKRSTFLLFSSLLRLLWAKQNRNETKYRYQSGSWEWFIWVPVYTQYYRPHATSTSRK